MNAGIAEILAIFLAIVGVGCIVAAASMVSIALAVLATGAFILLSAILLAYAASVTDRAEKAKAGGTP